MRHASLLLCTSLLALVLASSAYGLGRTPPPPGDGVIGDFVWHDRNGNGIQDDGPDSGIQGVVVILKVLWPNGGDVAMELFTITDATGHYRFQNLPVEEFDVGPFIHEVNIDSGPANANFGPHGALAGMHPTLEGEGDSDNDSNGLLVTTTLDPSDPIDLSLDFGFLGSPPVASCELELTARCQGASLPSGDDCDGKLTGLVLEYLGGGCAADANGQDGKSDCSGGVGFAASVDILVTDKSGNALADELDVLPGDLVEVVAATKFSSATFVEIVSDTAIENLEIHTSCSAPLAAGDRFGSLQVVEVRSTEGGMVSMGHGGADCRSVAGTDVEFSYEIHNAGSTAVSGILVSDAFGSIDPAIDLGAGQSTTVQVVETVWDDFSNHVVAAGPTCSAEADVRVKIVEDGGKKKAKKGKKLKKSKASKTKKHKSAKHSKKSKSKKQKKQKK